jgi:hypothetical protein
MLMFLHGEYVIWAVPLFSLLTRQVVFIWMFRSWDEKSILYKYTISRYSCKYDSGNRPVFMSLSLYDIPDMNGNDRIYLVARRWTFSIWSISDTDCDDQTCVQYANWLFTTDFLLEQGAFSHYGWPMKIFLCNQAFC